MASVQDMIDEINDHGFTDTSVTRKVALINDTVWDICAREPWPFLEQTINLNFDGTNPAPTNFPADFGSLLSLVIATNAADDSVGNALDPERWDVMERKYGDILLSTGTPCAYYFVGETLRVFYVPASNVQLRMDYLRKHPTLVSTSVATDILIPAEHHRAIVLGALYKLYNMDDDFDIGSSFQSQYEDRLLKMRNALWQRQYDRPDRIYGIDDFDLQFLS